MLIFEDTVVKVEYDNSIKAIVWTPKAFMKGKEWKIPFERGVEFLIKKIEEEPNITWLNDTRRLKTVSLDDLTWLNKNVNDPCYKAGLKKVAFVLPNNVFGRMAVKFYVDFTNKRSDNIFKIKAFRDTEEAVKWLTTNSNINVREEII